MDEGTEFDPSIFFESWCSMNVNTSVTIDLVQHGLMPKVAAMQNDSETRTMTICLTENGKAWEIPDDALPMVVYCKPSGLSGQYDTVNGQSAFAVDGSTITVTFASQLLTSPGLVTAAVVFSSSSGKRLSTFPFVIDVEPTPYFDGVIEDAGTDSTGSTSGFVLPTATVTQTANGATISITDKNGTTTATVKNGSDGVGIEQIVVNEDGSMDIHLTNATTERFQIPKGEKGDKGDPGPAYTLTVSDRDTIANAVTAALKNEIPLVTVAKAPVFVSSEDEMTDPGEVYVLVPDGVLWAYMAVDFVKLGAELFELGSIKADDGMDGGVSSSPNRVRTRHLPCTTETPMSIDCGSAAKWLAHFYRDETWLGKTSFVSKSDDDIVQLCSSPEDVTHVRIVLAYVSDANVTDIPDLLSNVTITQQTSGMARCNTGMAYNQPVDYEDRILAMEAELEVLVNGTF